MIKFINFELKDSQFIKDVCKNNLIPYFKDKINKNPDSFKSLNIIYKIMKVLKKCKIEHKLYENHWTKNKNNNGVVKLSYDYNGLIEEYWYSYNSKTKEETLCFSHSFNNYNYSINYENKRITHIGIIVKRNKYIASYYYDKKTGKNNIINKSYHLVNSNIKQLRHGYNSSFFGNYYWKDEKLR